MGDTLLEGTYVLGFGDVFLRFLDGECTESGVDLHGPGLADGTVEADAGGIGSGTESLNGLFDRNDRFGVAMTGLAL